ncbi:MAG TPA: MFS transporter [Anaeromyxobacteraceae bacterium]|nr:MFS transporter [Anaeromyxobacteraceae bacterium]
MTRPPLPPAFWWLWAGALLSALATFVWPFATLYLAARGLSGAEAGRVMSLFGVGMLLAPLAGALSDRVGRRPVMLGALCGASAGAAALAFTASRWALAAAILAYATCVTGLWPVVQAAVGDVVAPEGRPRAVALLHWANNFGSGVSLLLGGVLTARGWAVPFLADAGTTLVFAGVVGWRMPETRPEPRQACVRSTPPSPRPAAAPSALSLAARASRRVPPSKSGAEPPTPPTASPTASEVVRPEPFDFGLASVRPERSEAESKGEAYAQGRRSDATASRSRRAPSLLRDRPFLTLLALHVPFAAVFWQFMAAAPLDMTRHGLSTARYGLVLATNSAVIAVLQPVVVRFTPRLAPWRVLALAALLLGLGFGGYGLASSAPGYALATAVWTLGEIAYLPTAGALVQALAPPSLRGRYAGAYALAFGLGSVLAPLAGPTVLDRLGSRALWGGCLATAAAVAAGFALLRPGPGAGR